eukprot:3741390-Rhodomonas_salina.1
MRWVTLTLHIVPSTRLPQPSSGPCTRKPLIPNTSTRTPPRPSTLNPSLTVFYGSCSLGPPPPPPPSSPSLPALSPSPSLTPRSSAQE